MPTECPVQWRGVVLNAPDWSNESHTLAAAATMEGRFVVHLMVNAYWDRSSSRFLLGITLTILGTASLIRFWMHLTTFVTG
ncbi:MAG: hypothetical protein A4E63_01664 [Syntrophorhabdus sp. PtaU1.Bin050]|nr:MAG: hypothetical protein A4E63_01664 [Syntrophorhabdus sp. PtaU1.Bin050]